jgi:hypothetical protein
MLSQHTAEENRERILTSARRRLIVDLKDWFQAAPHVSMGALWVQSADSEYIRRSSGQKETFWLVTLQFSRNEWD